MTQLQHCRISPPIVGGFILQFLSPYPTSYNCSS